MKPKRLAFTLKHTALTFALMLAHAQGAWAGTTTTVALTGSAAPFVVAATVLSAVPEPSTWALMAAGLVGLTGLARRQRFVAAT